MKPNRLRNGLLWTFLLSGMLAGAGTSPVAWAGTQRTQTFQLRQGWNAVFLEVYPAQTDPARVFANTSVDIAASYYAPSASAQFITEPGVDLFRQSGWGVWYTAGRPDAFLKTLHAILGQQAYLLHAERDSLWTVTGEVRVPDIR